MLQCPNCTQVQEKGKFCGKCGTALGEMTSTTGEEAGMAGAASVIENTVEKHAPATEYVMAGGIAEKEAVAQPLQQHAVQNVAMQQDEAAPATPAAEGERLQGYKDDAMAYWGFLLELLKNPAKAFRFGEQSFMFGLINIILYFISFVAAVYFSVSSYLKTAALMFMSELFDMNSGAILQKLLMPTFLFVVMIVGLALVVLYLFEKVFVKQMSIRHLMAQYGSLLTPLLVLHVASITAGLMGSIIAALVLLGLSLFFCTHIFPALFLFEKMNFYEAQEQRIYITMGMTLSILVVTYIFGRITIFNIISDSMKDLFELFSYF